MENATLTQGFGLCLFTILAVWYADSRIEPMPEPINFAFMMENTHDAH